MNYYLISLALCASIVALLSIYFIKQYIIDKNILYLVLALFSYLLLIYSYIKLFEIAEVSSTYTILQILQILIVLIMGIVFFKETLNMNKIIGIVLGLISVYLLLN